MSTARPRDCTRCGGRLERGYLLDHTHGGRMPTRWVEQEPIKSFWMGLKLGGRRQLPIEAWRCQRCDALELFAPAK